ncbi:MAG: 4-hydroxythreonine-4-phosphate dehydrogenase PdxA [Polyangiaceae bacterium]
MRSDARLVVSVGCASGIGPEVSVAAAVRARARVVLVGDGRVVRNAARSMGVPVDRFVDVPGVAEGFSLPKGRVGVHRPGRALAAADAKPGAPTRETGRAQLEWIDAALGAVTSGAAEAMVTGPVSKEAVVRSGAPRSRTFRGHTEYLQERLGADEVVMAFWSPALTTALVTTHLPLAKVPGAVTKAKVATATFWLGAFMAEMAGVDRARAPAPVAVAGLNPHAGERGLLGHEETRIIAKGMDLAAKRLARAKVPVELRGPVPAESAFRLAKDGVFSAVVAMYHDQATIPMKLLGFGEAVNVSLGLPVIRTSVDHGTGYDRAGKGTANADGMATAMDLAARLAITRRT